MPIRLKDSSRQAAHSDLNRRSSAAIPATIIGVL
jgi:hypothetical protein